MARHVSSMSGARKSAGDTWASWWRRWHRLGHAALKKHQYDPESARRRSVHRLAGHLARDTGLCGRLLRVRHLAWWRVAQQEWQKSDLAKHGGVHAARFHCKRWEHILELAYPSCVPSP
eukprot:574761-Prorocentrum_lima.AAC.1